MKGLFIASMLSVIMMSGVAHAALGESAYPFAKNPVSPVVDNRVDQQTNQDSAYPNIVSRSSKSRQEVVSELITYKELFRSEPSDYRGR